jgi:predicted phage terminase large subunit-like protein
MPFCKRLNYPDLKRAVREQAQLHHANSILIEDKASGTQLIQDLKAEGTWGVKPYAPPPGSNKTLRLYAQTAEFENGRVLLPRSAPWLDEYIRELTTFPGSKYDDQVDSTTQALEHLRTNRLLEIWSRL